MESARSGPNPLSPNEMSARQRLAEVGRLLAGGYIRMHAQKSSSLSADGGDSSLDILALKSGRGHRLRNHTGGQ